MKTYLVLLLLFFSTLFVDAEETRSLLLLTYNIHAGIGVDRKFDLERIAVVIKNTQSHVVALQEVDKETKRSLLSANLVFEGESIQILATHLCHRESANRVTAAKFITEKQAPRLEPPS